MWDRLLWGLLGLGVGVVGLVLGVMGWGAWLMLTGRIGERGIVDEEAEADAGALERVIGSQPLDPYLVWLMNTWRRPDTAQPPFTTGGE